MTIAPSQHELGSLAAACQRLWSLDVNGLRPGQEYVLNPQVGSTSRLACWSSSSLIFYVLLQQHGKKSYMEQDVAPGPLFSQVNPAIFQHRSTYALFYALLDNYHA